MTNTITPGEPLLSRTAFNVGIDDFREAISETISAAPHPCRFLASQLEMLSSLRFLDRLYKDLNEFLPYLQKGAVILDIGTGSGIAAFMLAAQGYTVKGIDIDYFSEDESHTTMGLEQKLVWRTMMNRHTNIHFQHYQDNIIPFVNSSFDAIAAYGVIEHIPPAHLTQVMAEIQRVTKPGGHLLISYLPRKLALLELVLALMRRPHHVRRWGDGEILCFLDRFNFKALLRKRIIFAPQFPANITNRHKTLFDRLDRLAQIPPFSLLARDLLIVGQKR